MYILWVACFLGEVNKIFEFFVLLYFYRAKMDYYLFRNAHISKSRKLQCCKLTNIKCGLF